jgi:hypothetical protein
MTAAVANACAANPLPTGGVVSSRGATWASELRLGEEMRDSRLPVRCILLHVGPVACQRSSWRSEYTSSWPNRRARNNGRREALLVDP